MDKRDMKAMFKAFLTSLVLVTCLIASFLTVGVITNNIYYATLSTLLIFVFGMLIILYYFPKLFEEYIDYYNKKVSIDGEKKE